MPAWGGAPRAQPQVNPIKQIFPKACRADPWWWHNHGFDKKKDGLICLPPELGVVAAPKLRAKDAQGEIIQQIPENKPGARLGHPALAP